VLSRAEGIDVEAIAVDVTAAVVTVPAGSVPVSGSVSDVEESVWQKAQTRITVFSAQQYVENYLAPPFHEAGFENLHFIDVSERLDTPCILFLLVVPACCGSKHTPMKPQPSENLAQLEAYMHIWGPTPNTKQLSRAASRTLH